LEKNEAPLEGLYLLHRERLSLMMENEDKSDILKTSEQLTNTGEEMLRIARQLSQSMVSNRLMALFIYSGHYRVC
jgi:hypothetical protein